MDIHEDPQGFTSFVEVTAIVALVVGVCCGGIGGCDGAEVVDCGVFAVVC